VPHRYVTGKEIANLEQEIITCGSSIQRIRTIKSGGSDGMKELAAQIRDLMETAKDKKDMALDLMMGPENGPRLDPRAQEKLALICRGQEKAFQIVLDMLENPDSALHYYENQKLEFEKELAKYRAFERRDE
jgi:hypothetical protein